jgi:hypothetical protein
MSEATTYFLRHYIYKNYLDTYILATVRTSDLISCDPSSFNPLNANLNTICHLLALLAAHRILHISRRRVNRTHSSECDFSYLETSGKFWKGVRFYRNGNCKTLCIVALNLTSGQGFVVDRDPDIETNKDLLGENWIVFTTVCWKNSLPISVFDFYQNKKITLF